MQTTMASSCVAYETSSPTTSGPVFNFADRAEEVARGPTDDVAARDEECYGWLSRVESSRLPGWGPKYNSTRWLDTWKDMNREQWSSCEFLSGQVV